MGHPTMTVGPPVGGSRQVGGDPVPVRGEQEVLPTTDVPCVLLGKYPTRPLTRTRRLRVPRTSLGTDSGRHGVTNQYVTPLP